MHDKRLEILRFISPGKRPAHITGSITHIGPNAAGSAFLFVGQGLDDKWHH